MTTLRDLFEKHAKGCEQCRITPENPCVIGGRILSAAATAKITKKVVIIQQKPK